MGYTMNIPHIPTGHELVKRYHYYDTGPGGTAGLDEDRDGQFVRLDDVKEHLVEWLKGELAKAGPSSGEFGYKHGYELALRGMLHHIEVIL